jgi:hypothetical protein
MMIAILASGWDDTTDAAIVRTAESDAMNGGLLIHQNQSGRNLNGFGEMIQAVQHVLSPARPSASFS